MKGERRYRHWKLIDNQHVWYDLFIRQKAIVEKQMEALKNTMNLIEHKCHYYKVALEAGTEDVHKKNKIGNTVFES